MVRTFQKAMHTHKHSLIPTHTLTDNDSRHLLYSEEKMLYLIRTSFKTHHSNKQNSGIKYVKNYVLEKHKKIKQFIDLYQLN